MFRQTGNLVNFNVKWKTMQISGETARYALSHMNLHCLQNTLIALAAKVLNI